MPTEQLWNEIESMVWVSPRGEIVSDSRLDKIIGAAGIDKELLYAVIGDHIQDAIPEDEIEEEIDWPGVRKEWEQKESKPGQEKRDG